MTRSWGIDTYEVKVLFFSRLIDSTALLTIALVARPLGFFGRFEILYCMKRRHLEGRNLALICGESPQFDVVFLRAL